MTNNLAQQLWQARIDGSLVDASTVELPSDEASAYELQHAISELADVDIVGFKIGATSKAALIALGLNGSFHGPLFDCYFRDHGADVPLWAQHKAILEVEVAVGLDADLPTRDAEYTPEDVAAAAAWISPAFEIVATRFDIELAGNGNLLIADSGANLDFILGNKTTDWSSFNLMNHPVQLYLNDDAVANGHSGMSLYGQPFGAVAWLANHHTIRDRGLKAGDVITTGTCTGMTSIAAGDQARADFGPLGAVTASFVEAS